MLNEFSKKEAPIQGLAGMGGGVPSRLLTLASGAATYVDDVFSTYLYEGTGSAQTITNNIDISGEGALVWIKSRTQTTASHCLYDTERDAGDVIFSNSSNAETTDTSLLSAFTSSGFSLGTGAAVNQSGEDYCSWTFRKCPGFFDVVTYTGNGVAGRTVAHSLGSVPGCIMIKCLDVGRSWVVYHRGLDSTAPEDYRIVLNSDAARVSDEYNVAWNSTAPTDTEFTLGTYSGTNGNGNNYVAYIFAHNDGSFGEDSDEAVIKCGSYTGDASNSNFVSLGFEPQFLLIKNATTASTNWMLFDVMRGLPVISGATARAIFGNTNAAETNNNSVYPSATGFTPRAAGSYTNTNGDTFIYVAIRRPHKPPSSGTDVFNPSTQVGTVPNFSANFPVDFAIRLLTAGGNTTYSQTVVSRLTGETWLTTSQTNSEGTPSGFSIDLQHMDGWGDFGGGGTGLSFKRAPGFMDVVAYTGTGSARNINHNLTVEPELAIIKSRDATGSWIVGSTAFSSGGHLVLDETGGMNNVGSTTRLVYANWSSTVLGIGADSDVNNSSTTYAAFLFASLAGISKVGTYSGTGSDGINVDCGFTTGARFVMIKRTDSTGNWFVWDSNRGIVSGNDPYILLNSTSAQDTTTDYIDPLNAGFTVNGSSTAQINTSGGTYLFLAIA